MNNRFFFTSAYLKAIFQRNIIKIDWHVSQVAWNFLEPFQLSDFNEMQSEVTWDFA